MSSLLHDIPTQTVFALALGPASLNANTTGSSFQLPDGDGTAFAVLQVGGIEDGTTVTAAFEQSNGNGSWSAVACDLSPLTAHGVTTAALTPTTRLLRCTVTLTGSDPQADVAVLVGQQKKVV